jgi:hypothetical protein
VQISRYLDIFDQDHTYNSVLEEMYGIPRPKVGIFAPVLSFTNGFKGMILDEER